MVRAQVTGEDISGGLGQYLDPGSFPSCPTGINPSGNGLPHFIPNARIDLEVLQSYVWKLIDSRAPVQLGTYPSDDAVSGIWVASSVEIFLEDARILIADTQSWRVEQQQIKDTVKVHPIVEDTGLQYIRSLTWRKRLRSGRATRTLNPWPFVMRPRPSFLYYLECRLYGDCLPEPEELDAENTISSLRSAMANRGTSKDDAEPGYSLDDTTQDVDAATASDFQAEGLIQAADDIAGALVTSSNQDNLKEVLDATRQTTQQIANSHQGSSEVTLVHGNSIAPYQELSESQDLYGNVYGDTIVSGSEHRIILGSGSIHDTTNHYHNQYNQYNQQDSSPTSPERSSTTRNVGFLILGASLVEAGHLTSGIAGHIAVDGTKPAAGAAANELSLSASRSDCFEDPSTAQLHRSEVSIDNITRSSQLAEPFRTETYPHRKPVQTSGTQNATRSAGSPRSLGSAIVQTPTKISHSASSHIRENLPPLDEDSLLLIATNPIATKSKPAAEVIGSVFRGGDQLSPSPNLPRSTFSAGDMLSAVWNGDHDSVREMLEDGADPNMTDSLGRSPLLYAVGQEDMPTTVLLLKYGANPNIIQTLRKELQHDRLAPLAKAISIGDCAMILCLLNNGAELPEGAHTSRMCNQYKKSDPGFDFPHLGPERFKQRDTVHPATSLLCLAIHFNNTKLFLKCIDAGIDINMLPDSPLHEAVIRRQYANIRTLLEHGARVDTIACYDPDTPTRGFVDDPLKPETALMIATRIGDVESVRLLVLYDIDKSMIVHDYILDSSEHSRTALDYAVVLGRFEIAQLLSDCGYCLRARNRDFLEAIGFSVHDWVVLDEYNYIRHVPTWIGI